MTGLMKPKEYDWKDSNLALFGSDTDKRVKKESAQTEEAWNGVTEISEPCIKVWRINKFKVEAVPEKEHGMFYAGDSYIVLKVTKVGDALHYDAHFWIGTDSTADEYGTAAYKTVELDTLLDDRAIQHREVMSYESEKFIDYFKKFETLRGGYASGFNHVAPEEYKPRLMLFHVCKEHAELRETTLSKNALNPADVFILDLGTKAYQWNGEQSSGKERIAAAQFLQQLESERNGRCTTEVLEQSDVRDSHPFMENLPEVPVEQPAPHDEAEKSLYKMSDNDGKMCFNKVSAGVVPKDMITEDDVYFIDSKKGLFVYIGKDCSHEEKLNALGKAHQYLKGTAHPLAPITVVGHGETDEDLIALLD